MHTNLYHTHQTDNVYLISVSLFVMFTVIYLQNVKLKIKTYIATNRFPFIELPDNRRLRRHLPNDLPTRLLVHSVIVILVFNVCFVSFISKSRKWL
jgi:preprotein translocase subunit SecY